jgi:hypothetical protein
MLSVFVAGCALVLSGSAAARGNDDHPPRSHRATSHHYQPPQRHRSRSRDQHRYNHAPVDLKQNH